MQHLKHASDSTPIVCATDVLMVVLKVTSVIRGIADHHRAGSLSIPQLRALGFLRHNPQARLDTLADNLSITASAASRLINGLVNKSLVTRSIPMKNRRQVSLVITPAGEAVLNVATLATQQHLAHRLACLSVRERHIIRVAMALLHSVVITHGGLEV